MSHWKRSLAIVLSLTILSGCNDDPPFGTLNPDTGTEADSDATPDDLSSLQDADTAPDRAIEDDSDDAQPDTVVDSVAEVDQDTAPETLVFADCTGRDFEVVATEEWNSPILSGATLLLGGPGHSIEDTIVTLTDGLDAPQVEGKFAYGTVSKDLEDETVQAFVDDCTEWVDLGTGLTDTDGRVQFTLPDSVLAGPSRNEVRMVVQGDASNATGYVLTVPAATQFVVFDIDGTLTTGDSELAGEIFSEMFGGDFVPAAYADGNTLTSAYAEAGFELIYITGRPYWLTEVSRTWLRDLGYPIGTLHLTKELGELLPTNDGVGAYKRDYLGGVGADHDFFRAYGNSTTDSYAYIEVGIPPEDVYMIGENGGVDGTNAVESWTDHLDAITIPDAEQPFER